jgi:hypothetical protein
VKTQNSSQSNERIRNGDEEENEELKEEESQNEEEREAEESQEKKEEESPRQDTKIPSRILQRNHPESLILGNKSTGVATRRKLTNRKKKALLSLVEPKTFAEANKNEYWIKSTNEEMDQIDKNQTWEHVPRPKNKNGVGTKWIFKNKFNEDGEVIRNEARFVCKGYVQVEGIDFEDTFSLLARLEAIRMFLTFVCFKYFKVYQMDVESTFLNGNL